MKTKPQVFLEMCDTLSQLSKDPSSKFGCVIVGPKNEIRSVGYNSFPRGINDDVAERFDRPEKYFWFEHAERNAIYNAARVGIPTEGCDLYVSAPPCMDCARAIIQSGIKRIVLPGAGSLELQERWKEHFARTKVLLGEARVEISIGGQSMNSNYEQAVA